MNEIKQRLEQYVSQFNNILQNLENFKNYSDPNKELEEDVISKGIGILAEAFSESSTVGRIGKKWVSNKLKAERKQNQNQILANQEYNFRSILNQIKNYLNTVSIKKNNLKLEGNSNLLLKKFASIESYSKLETKIRRSITILSQIKEEPLIYNTKISELKKEKKVKDDSDYYQVLQKLEQNMRPCISENLSKISTEWWKQRVPEDVRKNAEKRKKKNESPWLWIKGGNPLIDFIDFTDYGKIITRKDNWSEVFRYIFEDKEQLLSKLKELEPIRNTIMHSRNLTKKQKERLQLYSDDILLLIKNAK